jgi:hypothetical protein
MTQNFFARVPPAEGELAPPQRCDCGPADEVGRGLRLRSPRGWVSLEAGKPVIPIVEKGVSNLAMFGGIEWYSGCC